MRSWRISNTTTFEPPAAASAAEAPPAWPAPNTTTLPRSVDGRPPSSLPLPPIGLVQQVRADLHPILPAMTDIGASSGRSPLGSSTVSKAMPVRPMSSSCLRQHRLGGQVQVAEQQVILAQVLQVARDRLLDLHDQLALLVQRGGVRRDLHAELGVLLVLEAALEAGALLQPDLVATLDQIAGGGRHERDAAFEGLGFLGYADPHCRSLKCAA